MTTPALAGDGLVLNPLTPDDAPALFAAHGDPEAHRYWASPAHASVEETRAYIAATLAIANAQAWSIREAGAEILGRIALFVLRDGVGEIGLILRRDAHGRGVAARALALVERHGFETLGLHRIFADIDPDNRASLRLFEKAGYAREGLLRGNWRTHLGVRDSIIMAKLRTDVS